MLSAGGGCGSLVGHSKIATAKKDRRICQRIGTRKESSACAFRKASCGRAICDGLCTGTGHNRIWAKGFKRHQAFGLMPQDIRTCSEAPSAHGRAGMADSLL